MNAGGRSTRALVALSAGFALGALLLVVQTAAFRLVAFDAPHFHGVTVAIRAAFCAADVLLLAALVALGRREPPVRGLLVMAAAATGTTLLSGLVGMLASGPRAGDPATCQLDATLSATETPLVLGAALLGTLALLAMAQPHGERASRRAHLLAALLFFVLALSLGLHFTSLLLGARPLAVAWIAWAAQVSRGLLLAAFAALVARARARAAPAVEVGPHGGAYRAPAPGAPRPLRAPLPVDEATTASLEQADAALRRYAVALGLRIAFSAGSVLLVVSSLATMRDGAMLMPASPIAGVVTSVLLVRALRSLRGVPAPIRLKHLWGALLAMAAAGLLDLAASLLGLITLANGAGDERAIMNQALVVWPITACLFWMSTSFAARALGGLGEQLEVDAVTRRSATTVALLVGAAMAAVGTFFTGLGQGQDADAGAAVFVVFALGTVGLNVAALTMQLLLVRAARHAVVAAGSLANAG
ncbi:MAG: hypothetical protein JWP97_3405 [Labilithrix sp.]|nr:hypothetical protein [Labilithrix sp.]